jgi:hypothetical protein
MDTYAFQAEVTHIRPIGLTARGLRIDISLTGRVTEGQLTGSAVEIIDYLLIRPDGVGVIDARDMIFDGDRVIETSRDDLSAAAATVYGFTGSANIGAGLLKLSAHSLATASEPVGVD